MKTAAIAIVSLLATAARAQAPAASPTLTQVSLTSYVGFTPLPLDAGKTPQTSPCASSPYTTDSKIYTVILKVLPTQITGATPTATPNVWASTSDPNQLYFVTGSAGASQIKTSRRNYDVAFVNAAAEIVVPDLTWADASDILVELKKSPLAVTGLSTTISPSASLSLIPVTLPEGTTANQLLQALADEGARLHSKTGWANAIQILQRQTPAIAGVKTRSAIPLTIPTASTAVTTNLTDAIDHLNGLVNAVGIRGAVAKSGDAAAAQPIAGPIFLVDSPCLTVSLLPATTGQNVTGGIVNFSGRYLFPFAKGHSFARIGIAGVSPLDRSANGAASTLTATLDAALNEDMNVSDSSGPIRFTGGATASFEHNQITGSSRVSKASGGLKGSVSFPTFTTLTGNDTRPTLTFEAAGSSINGAASDSSQFEGSSQFKAKFRWTPIFNSAVDATYKISHDAIYGGRKSNYVIRVDVLRFIVRDPLEFAAAWTCGRPAPEFKRVCGFYTGFSLTSQQ